MLTAIIVAWVLRYAARVRGHATLVMPLLVPLSDFAGVSRPLTITAWILGHGFALLFSPTSVVLVGGLAIAKVGYDRYLRLVWPLLLILFIVCSRYRRRAGRPHGAASSRDAAPEGARTADEIMVHDGHAGTLGARCVRGGLTCRAGADDDEVELHAMVSRPLCLDGAIGSIIGSTGDAGRRDERHGATGSWQSPARSSACAVRSRPPPHRRSTLSRPTDWSYWAS